jgi:hypothetical protein
MMSSRNPLDDRENVMGTLVAFRYPTQLLLKLADHTYVACSTLGKAWGCWGGNTGGTEFRRAPGSTQRADAIAEPDERAGITCYLVNGVCHQAANRILLPAGITVQGARGYAVSSALFGAYGRPRGILGFCRAPFDRHPGVSGDLDACIEGTRLQGSKDSGAPDGSDGGGQRERAYLERTLQMFPDSERQFEVFSGPDEIVRFQLAQFDLFLDYKFGDDPQHREFIDGGGRRALLEIREETERERLAAEQRFADSRDTKALLREDDELTLKFQSRVGKVLDGKRYAVLLDLEKGDDVTLADPEILEYAYRRRPSLGR